MPDVRSQADADRSSDYGVSGGVTRPENPSHDQRPCEAAGARYGGRAGAASTDAARISAASPSKSARSCASRGSSAP